MAMARLRGISIYYREIADNGVYFEERRVRDPREFAGLFQKNDNVLKMHVDGIQRRELVQLLTETLGAPARIKMRAAGHVGIYMDTGNAPLQRFFLKVTGGIHVPMPFLARIKTFTVGIYHELFYGYPRDTVFDRVIVSFECCDDSPDAGGAGPDLPASTVPGDS